MKTSAKWNNRNKPNWTAIVLFDNSLTSLSILDSCSKDWTFLYYPSIKRVSFFLRWHNLTSLYLFLSECLKAALCILSDVILWFCIHFSVYLKYHLAEKAPPRCIGFCNMFTHVGSCGTLNVNAFIHGPEHVPCTDIWKLWMLPVFCMKLSSAVFQMVFTYLWSLFEWKWSWGRNLVPYIYTVSVLDNVTFSPK